MSLTPMGLLPREGATVQACREPGDEFEPATVQESNLQAGMIALRFADGYRTEVPFTQVKLETTAVNDDMEEVDQAYEDEVRPTLPLPPTAEALAADPEARYAFIAAGKDAGNALFKQGKYAWAIRTYCDSVNSLAASCFESRERMLWDYQAREPCCQCYSNAALCALKLEEHARAVELCEQAMGCRPEEADLLKLLLRHGQALGGLGRLDEAKERLERGVAMQPTNRPLREELLKVKRRVLEADRAAEKRMFAKVDLSSSGLTSKKDHFASQLEATLARGTEQMLDGKDEQALLTTPPQCCAPHAHRMRTACAPHAHRMRTACAPHAHRMCTACAPHVHRMCTACTAHTRHGMSRHSRRCRLCLTGGWTRRSTAPRSSQQAMAAEWPHTTSVTSTRRWSTCRLAPLLAPLLARSAHTHTPMPMPMPTPMPMPMPMPTQAFFRLKEG